MSKDGNQNSSESIFVGTYSIYTKVVQVLFATLSLGLIVEPLYYFHQVSFGHRSTKLEDIWFTYITLGSFIIINTVFVIFHTILGERIPKTLGLMFTMIGGLFHIIAAGLIFLNWQKIQGAYIITYDNEINDLISQYSDMLKYGGVLTFILFTAFLVDAFVTLRYNNIKIRTVEYFSLHVKQNIDS